MVPYFDHVAGEQRSVATDRALFGPGLGITRKEERRPAVGDAEDDGRLVGVVPGSRHVIRGQDLHQHVGVQAQRVAGLHRPIGDGQAVEQMLRFLDQA